MSRSIDRRGFSGNNGDYDSDNDDDDALATLYAYFLGYALLMSIVVLVSKLLHDRPRTIGAILPEAGLIILCGMLAGGCILLWEHLGETNLRSRLTGAPESLLIFSPNVFFVGLLPPIICTFSMVCVWNEARRVQVQNSHGPRNLMGIDSTVSTRSVRF
jgi:hypothetical protein